MKRKLEVSELIFRILSYFFLTVFALMCLYPFVYAVSASISGRHAVEYGEVVLLPAAYALTDVKDHAAMALHSTPARTTFFAIPALLLLTVAFSMTLLL